jgi:hypothetical protein
MKNLLLLAALAIATTEAATAAPSQTTPGTMTKKERKAARQAKSPQVYKGSVAEQRRLVTDAPGAEESDNGDNTTTKSKRKSKSKE